jgi:hypothetical protein
MMEKLQKRGELLAGQRLARVKSEIKAVLAEELPGDVHVEETQAGVAMTARGLQQRLARNGGPRDIGFLMRGVR